MGAGHVTTVGKLASEALVGRYVASLIVWFTRNSKDDGVEVFRNFFHQPALGTKRLLFNLKIRWAFIITLNSKVNNVQTMWSY